MCLYTGPEFNRGAELACQTQGSVSADAAISVADLANTHGRNADVFGQPILADPHGL